MILSIILCLIFTVLGGFHFYWLFGGVWGLKKVIPTKGNEKNMLAIPKFGTLVVGLVLVAFGLIYLIKSGLINIQIPNWIAIYGYWFIPSVFILRAIGEFRYVGFFKKIKNTEFSKADSKIFSPLCLVIGVIGILIQLIK
ncbi:hypothetical protein ATO12_15565 [Aquimarina atlantica]|uniref:DUF3995 domain-containing protein n=1 Tax=Aquimarina atlantica TaxID=1317122 RepID=A0A023BW63_9FLAO|nr:DUF3995 domain-containing protein [Aquimarina atlantica]EZH74282.1 hypothetical protein ATO12_15565 [Aquimarina atlantica]